MRKRPVEDRFAEKYAVDAETKCWNWTGAKVKGGYGMIGQHRQHAILAHRFSYLHHVGEIPPGKIVRHSCHNPACVNPNHLLLGTHAENMKDLDASGRARVLSASDVEKIQTLLQTFSQNAVARLYGVDRSTIQRAVSRHQNGDAGPPCALSDGDKNHVFLSQADKDEIVRLLRTGQRVMSIAMQFGIDRKTVRNLRPDDVPRPPMGRPKKNKDTSL